MTGRHGGAAGAGAPASSDRAASRSQRRQRSRSLSRRTVVVVGLVVLALPAAAVGGLIAAGVPLIPQAAAPAAAVAPAPSAVPAAASVTTPAGEAVGRILATGPGSGWAPAGPITWAPGTPFDHACGATGVPAAAVSGARVFVSKGGRTLTVSARAYGAGVGAAAFAALSQRAASCPGRSAEVSAWSADAGGIDALEATVRPDGSPTAVSVLAWRRGDVVLAVLAPGSSPDALSGPAHRVDAGATGILKPVCPDLGGRADDLARNPWYDRTAYVGWLVTQGVTLPRAGLPEPPAGIVARPLTSTADPLPAVVLPQRPADPLWPTALPSPVASPVLPPAPGPEPTSATVEVQQRDDVGPGCGWAFTGAPAPQLDDAAIIAGRESVLQNARAGIEARQRSWQQTVVSWWTTAAQYDAAATAFRAYAEQVAVVGAAWNRISSERTVYAALLAEYQRAKAALARYQREHDAALAAYDAAVAACESPGEPTPTPTASPSPSTTGSPSPSTTPPPAPSPSPTAVCPPPRPAILDQPLPPVPPSPTPPADPRPNATPAPAAPSPSR